MRNKWKMLKISYIKGGYLVNRYSPLVFLRMFCTFQIQNKKPDFTSIQSFTMPVQCITLGINCNFGSGNAPKL